MEKTYTTKEAVELLEQGKKITPKTLYKTNGYYIMDISNSYIDYIDYRGTLFYYDGIDKFLESVQDVSYWLEYKEESLMGEKA